MTPAEITAYVMALPVEELRRLSATYVMGWEYWYGEGELRWSEPCDHIREKGSKKYVMLQSDWRPDEDRNQSRMVVLKVAEAYGPDCIVDAMYDVTKDHFYDIATPDQETRAGLIAHMIHKQEVGE